MKKIFLCLVLLANLRVFSCLVELDIDRGVCRIDEIAYPMVGFGTSTLTGKVCIAAVEQAIENGYRIIDTATYYKNFDSIAQALEGRDRSHYYIISKVWYDSLSSDDIRRDLSRTLKQLKTDHIDAYLVHWPNSKMPIEETLDAMNKLKEEGQIRHIGLSNVTVNHLKRALKIGIPITWVQIEMHPYFYDKEVVDFCKENAIAVQAWGPLNFGQVKGDEVLSRIGRKYNATACQVALRWILQHGCIPLPKSKNQDHIQKNCDVSTFSLSPNEMEEIDQRALKGTRFRIKEERGFGFTDEFDFSYEACWPNQT